MLYVIYYFVGFLSCLFLLTIIVEVNDRTKKHKKELKRTYRKQLYSQQKENEKLLDDIKDNINIDVKVY